MGGALFTFLANMESKRTCNSMNMNGAMELGKEKGEGWGVWTRDLESKNNSKDIKGRNGRWEE